MKLEVSHAPDETNLVQLTLPAYIFTPWVS